MRTDLLTGNDQKIVGRRFRIRRGQLAAAEGQTGQRGFIVRPRAADIFKVGGKTTRITSPDFQTAVF